MEIEVYHAQTVKDLNINAIIWGVPDGSLNKRVSPRPPTDNLAAKSSSVMAKPKTPLGHKPRPTKAKKHNPLVLNAPREIGCTQSN